MDDQMATLQQTLYQKILNVTQYAHDIVYKGDRNRNRYQLTENLFVQYNAGLVTHIFDTDKGLGLKLIMVSDSDADLVRADMIEMGPKGFYVDVQNLSPTALKLFTPLTVIESYTRTQTPLINQLKTVFDQLLTTVK